MTATPRKMAEVGIERFRVSVGRDSRTAEADRRRSRRISIQTEVWRGEAGIFTRGNERLANLSVGGAFIHGDGTTIGNVLNLRFRLPGTDDYITSTAIGRNTRSGGLGVEFLDLSSDNLTRLTTFIDAH